MELDQVVLLGRTMLKEVVILVGPLLVVVIVVSLVVNVLQVLTSLQDSTISTVTRLLTAGLAAFFMMPWMWRHLAQYTLTTLGDFNGYLQ